MKSAATVAVSVRHRTQAIAYGVTGERNVPATSPSCLRPWQAADRAAVTVESAPQLDVFQIIVCRITQAFNSPATCLWRSLYVSVAVSACAVNETPDIFAARCYASKAYAVMRRLSVCLSVRPSRSWILSKRINISSFLSPSDNHIILIFPHQTSWRYSDGDPPNGGVECRWGRQINCDSRPVSGFIACCQRCDRHVLSTRFR